MPEVTRYVVLFYGSKDGYKKARAQIQVWSREGVAGYIRFKDLGMEWEADHLDNGVVRMYLPSTMFQSVLDVLRNEKPTNIYFAAGRGFFGTEIEPVGESE